MIGVIIIAIFAVIVVIAAVMGITTFVGGIVEKLAPRSRHGK